MTSSREIRQKFLDFFAEQGHQVVPSGPLVPANDPTLMFANAGMVQFKDVFTGTETRDYRRATSSQKCIRISGKHNDLENVGVTARHHTFFEMLGNFSFGDYFKRDAIRWAWEFITGVMEIPKERLVVTVFGGEAGVPADDEAAQLWTEVAGLPPERIIRCGLKDNFWQMGDTGPCGPSSEIHYYVGDPISDPSGFAENEQGTDGIGWFELWNLVFMQFDRQADGELRPLPAPSIDTGAGLERLSAVKQGVRSNYDTDLLRPLVELAAEIAGKPYGGTQAPDDTSMRVIADHARTTAFLIAEGIFPDRDGRAYVLRRVMRRAIHHGHRLGIERLFLHECALRVVDMMGEIYPELVEARALIQDVTQQEEERFRKTLARGLELLRDNQEWNERDGMKELPGSVAFKLYDTYGFPIDLQAVIAAQEHFQIDVDGFAAELQAARERSAGSKVGEEAVGAVYPEIAETVGAVTFTGYETEEDRSTVLSLVRDGARVERLAAGESGEIVTPRTPFYGESGGQVGDQGEIRIGQGARFVVEDTKKPLSGLFVHRGHVAEGVFEVGAEVSLEVDHELRSATRRNHSATHLLHLGLREVLGPQAMQKGSLVGPDRLRFDYTGGRPLEPDEIRRIEDIVNAQVLRNTPVVTEVLPMDEAKARGAMGIFEEKYGAVVRMLRIGDSLELCGGTHARRTGDIGAFTILSESGLAAGVRRIEAATGLHVIAHLRAVRGELEATAQLVKAPPAQTREKVERLLERQRELGQEIERLKRQLMSGEGTDLSSKAREVDGVHVLGATVELGDAKALREMADQLRDKLAPAVVMLGSTTKDGKALLVCTVSKEITGRFQAGALVREAAKVVGGGGGGRADFAQAGGSDPSKLGDAVERVYAAVTG